MKYKLLGKTGLRVSELCLGTMTFGEDWKSGANKTESKRLFDFYANAGGNFLDTANFYTYGTSEQYLGDFIKGNRDHFVVSTKYALYDKIDDPNFMGNHRKNMMRSVNDSLKRLQTDYIDIFWLHIWDFTTDVEEVMRGLNQLVDQGKVLHIGVSDTPAWIIAKANMLARQNGWVEFSAVQLEYSLIERTAERDLFPMANDFKMTINTWSPLGAGILTGKYLEKMEGRLNEKSIKMTEENLEISRQLKEVADEVGRPAAQLALRWILQTNSNIIPIIGARKRSQLEDNFKCLDFELTVEQMQKLNKISEIDLGFPHEFMQRASTQKNLFGKTKKRITF